LQGKEPEEHLAGEELFNQRNVTGRVFELGNVTAKDDAQGSGAQPALWPLRGVGTERKSLIVEMGRAWTYGDNRLAKPAHIGGRCFLCGVAGRER
jgi:hypothetical protein